MLEVNSAQSVLKELFFFLSEQKSAAAEYCYVIVLAILEQIFFLSSVINLNVMWLSLVCGSDLW
jgi:hypothetical protein